MKTLKGITRIIFLTTILGCLLVIPNVKIVAQANLPLLDDVQRNSLTSAGQCFTLADCAATIDYATGTQYVNWVGCATSFGAEAEQSAVMFDISTLSGTISSAKFRIYIIDIEGSPVVNLISTTDNSWSKASLKFPTFSSSNIIGTYSNQAISAAGWKEFDVTSYIQSLVTASASKVSMVLTGKSTASDDDFDFSNKLNASSTYYPQLQVVFNPTVPTASVNQSLCSGATIADLTVTPPSGCEVKWYSASSGGTALPCSTTLTNGTKYYAESYYSATGYVSLSRTEVTANIYAPSVGGSVAGSTSVCSGTNSATLTLSSQTGNVIKWQSSIDNWTTPVDITNTTTSLTATNLTSTTKYRAVVQNGSCTNANSSDATITVSTASVGGSISGGSTVCGGTNSTTLTLSGYTGSITKWQSSVDNWTTPVDIANTTTSLTATNLTATTKYRAVIQSGVCSSANSSDATITVNSSVGGSISGGATVCSGTNSTMLTLSGYSGSILKWQSSTNNWASSTDIANTTTSLIATNLTSTTKYRAIVQNGSCTSANSSEATITVNPSSIGGSIAGGATVCSGTNSTTLTLSGYTGSITKWQSSVDNWTTPVDIANTTTSLTATNLTATTKYRAVVQSGVCSTANSSDATITVNSSVGGSISGGATVCSGTNSTTLSLSGYTGSILKWQSSTNNWTSGTDITNTTTSLTATNLTTTTIYRAVVQNGSCTSANSSEVTITVNAASVGGSITGGATVCSGTNNTTLTLSGNTGNVTKWQSSVDNWTTPMDITNTTISLTATNLAATTKYRAVVQNGSCTSANSSDGIITVNATSVGGSIAGGTTVCSGTNSTTLTLSGYTGSITKWQSSVDDWATPVDIANTTTSLTATNLTTTTKYRAVIQSGVCSSANSSDGIITVNATSVGGSIAGGVTVCGGTNSTTLTLYGYTGSIIKWQSSVDSWTTPVDITNTTTSLTATNLTATTKYRAVIQSGVCSSANSSDGIITVNAASVGGSIAGRATVCSGTNSTTLTLSGYTGSITKWQSSVDNWNTVVDIANTTTSLTAVNLTASTRFRAIVQNGSCSSINSEDQIIIVSAKPAKPTISQLGGSLVSSVSIGNQWYKLVGGPISGATGMTYIPDQSDNYFVIVSENGCSSDSSEVYHYIKTGVTNLNQVEMTIYPNPVNDVLTLLTEPGVKIYIYDMYGRIVYEQLIKEQRTYLNVKNLPSAVYTIKLVKANLAKDMQFVKE